MKCLLESKVPLAHRNVLHDWHAEVVTLSSLDRFLREDCLRFATALPDSELEAASKYIYYISWERYTRCRHYKLRDEVMLNMYCSEEPCGETSMELTIAAQEHATSWEVPARSAPLPPLSASSLHGGQELTSGLVMAARH